MKEDQEKPNYLLLLVTFFALLILFNLNGLSKTLSRFGIREYELLRKYLETFLSWPIAILIIVLVFIFKFSESIKHFLDSSNLKKIGPVEFEQRQQATTAAEIDKKAAGEVSLTSDQLQQIEKAFQEKETQLANKDGAIKFLLERSELIEFAYLNIILVYNTKIALMWFYLQVEHQSTKENFINLYILPPNIINPEIEKDAIFNALLSNQLIEQNGTLFKVNEKGKRFLKYLGFNVND